MKCFYYQCPDRETNVFRACVRERGCSYDNLRQSRRKERMSAVLISRCKLRILIIEKLVF